MKTLGVIPARSGSKGIPYKNVQLLCGKPLLHYTAEAALSAKLLDRVILSTDDEEIAQVGEACHLEVPFLRPAELARDDTPTLPVIQHAVRFIEDSGDRYDAICVLQPTNPLRRAEDIDGCIRMLTDHDLESVISVLPVPHEFNPHWVYFQDDQGRLRLSTGENTPISRRQDLPAAFHRDGSVYVSRRNVLMERNSLYGDRIAGYVMDPDRHVNIDALEDWKRAEELLEATTVLA
jgi:CMP-N,N'-diacetyllegionaminic acid synthase